MRRRILDDARHELVQQERRLLADLRVALVRLDGAAESQKALARSIAQLDELFLLVVVGEFNSGKSAVINTFLDETVLEEGVTPTTSRIGLVRHGPVAGRAPAGGGFEVIALPLEILREINIVDTPGTNTVLRGHEALTREFIPRADLLLFVTSADRPFTESERGFLEMIQSWGKKVVMVVNKVDILETPEQADTVVAFVKAKVLELLGFHPEVFAISARQARRAKTEGNEPLLRSSGFAALEDFVTGTLHEAVRVRLKLLNPLAVGLRVLDQGEQAVEERLALLRVDDTTLEEIDGGRARHRQDLARDVRFRLAEVEKVLFDSEKGGRDFLARTLRLARIIELINAEWMRSQLEQEVGGDLVPMLEKRVREIVDFVVASEVSQWQVTSESLLRRQAVHAGRIVGLAVGTFECDRSRLLSEIQRETQRALEGYDPRADAQGLAQALRWTAAGTILLPAMGLVALVAAFATTTLAAVTSVLAAAGLWLGGLVLLPTLRRRAGAKLGERVAALRETLMRRLKGTLDRQLDETQHQACEAVEPYRRFVQSEGERLRGQGAQLTTIRHDLMALKAQIESL
jgi:small GTP-binding protein